jgi:hypothetical protein
MFRSILTIIRELLNVNKTYIKTWIIKCFKIPAQNVCRYYKIFCSSAELDRNIWKLYFRSFSERFIVRMTSGLYFGSQHGLIIHLFFYTGE